MMRIAMVNHSGVVALFFLLFSAPTFMLGALAEENNAEHGVDPLSDGSMIDLSKEAGNWGRPRERRLQNGAFVWCISNPSASALSLQNSLDWACGPEPNEGQVNCGPINPGGACYNPQTLQHHCDWAFNAYFQRMNATSSACVFDGAAQTTTTDPSSGSCVFAGSNLTVVNGSANSPGSAPAPNLYGYGGAADLEPQFLFRFSTAVILFTYLFT